MARQHAFLFLALIAAGAAAQPATPAPDPAEVRKAQFRAFAEPFVGEWDCAIAEYDGRSDKPVWTDVQRRRFTLSMARHVLEERAWLKAPGGRWYEGGVHLMSFDPKSDRVTQHGFWLPSQADRLFFIEGAIAGTGFDGRMTIRLESGGEDTRPLRIRWRGRDEWTIEVDGRRADGSVFLRESVRYTRISTTPGVGPPAEPAR